MTTEMIRLLLLDDNAAFREEYAFFLEHHGFTVETAANGEEALARVGHFDPDIAMLDVELRQPMLNGLDVCQKLIAHSWYQQGGRGIVMLSGVYTASLDQIVGLEMGAHKYLTKELPPRQVLAELKALYRLLPQRDRPIRLNERVEIDLQRRIVLVNGQSVPLEPRQYQLLCYLVNRPNQAVSKDQLALDVWGNSADDPPTDSAIANVVSRLRGHIETDSRHPTLIETLPRYGYRLNFRQG